jgi:hypothetical protein
LRIKRNFIGTVSEYIAKDGSQKSLLNKRIMKKLWQEANYLPALPLAAASYARFAQTVASDGSS